MPPGLYVGARLRILGVIAISVVAVLLGAFLPIPAMGNMAFLLMADLAACRAGSSARAAPGRAGGLSVGGAGRGSLARHVAACANDNRRCRSAAKADDQSDTAAAEALMHWLLRSRSASSMSTALARRS
jgi:hypothetical protein